ncbi:heme biosynthesis HemY N-terminal domain-containing protein [Gallaecimonas sp. GXIMD4217]|uniref:heme biosynthesis protein HemY n=1 Tax=Gallaecimonas sp. GXIMD4217 TaxID=3131927 RepID=UPI00311B10AC
MRTFLLLIALLVLGLVLGPLTAGKKGYVLIAMGDYTVETNLVVLVLAPLVLYLLYRQLSKLVRWLFKRPDRNKKLDKGWGALWQGRYRQAGAALEASAGKSQQPDLPQLAAAWAAHLEGNGTELQARLDKIREPLAAVALLSALGETEAARARWQQLEQEKQDSPLGQRLAARLALQQGDLAGLWPRLDALPEAERERHYLPALLARIEQAAHDEGAAGLARLRQVLSRKVLQEPAVIAAFARAYHSGGQHDEALELLMTPLKKQLDRELLMALVQVAGTSSDECRRRLLKWHHKGEQPPVLLAVLGKLSLNAGEAEEAQRYLQAALDHQDDPQWRLWLAQVQESRGATDQALLSYKQVL